MIRTICTGQIAPASLDDMMTGVNGSPSNFILCRSVLSSGTASLLLFLRPQLLDGGAADFLLWGESMAKIIVDSEALERIAQEVDHCGFMLGFVNDEDDIDDVGFHARRIRDAASNLCKIVKKSEPVEPARK